MTTTQTAAAAAVDRLSDEVGRTLADIASSQDEPFARLADSVVSARRVFVLGAGRSGLALRMTAMRLMHLGLAVHVVGETTTPAIASGDLLLAASGSGTTGGIVRSATTARDAGAAIAAITTDPSSPLAELADIVVRVPAAGKLDRSGSASAQYAGSLFEQTVVLLGDALFHGLWQRGGASADDLWRRHANLE
ncbi:6-phospho-3-hexuloisomerase [Microbacterium karelineae]|uniref:6-phospho-3-hexuloisomerase n=1 Tax=Microbacterium karelineae TaxID=2654283 RepID=UPI0012EAEFC5|nr:6-phospho-3-hexuloisomerase [Microbacterium karelineae]